MVPWPLAFGTELKLSVKLRGMADIALGLSQLEGVTVVVHLQETMPAELTSPGPAVEGSRGK